MRRDFSGLGMLGATLAVVAIVLLLIAGHEVEVRREQIRTQGLGLANAISRIPLSRLVPAPSRLGPLSLIGSESVTPTSLVYVMISDDAQVVLDQIVRQGITPPPTPVSVSDPASWSGEYRFEIGPAGERGREFTAPILEGERFVGSVRIGFREPGYWLVAETMSLHASVALAVLLLVPFAQMWLRREIRPIARAAHSLRSDDAGVEILPGPAIAPSPRSIALRLEAIHHEHEQNAEAIARERIALLASTKVAAHERNRFQMLLEANPDGILALDEHGAITFLNGRAETLLRKSRAELLGSMPSVWSPSPELSQLVSRYCGAKGRLARSEAVEFGMPEYADRRFHARVLPVESAQGSTVVLREITEEWIARKTQAEFLAHMAHELKAPLNVIGMYSETLLGIDGQDEATRVDCCNVIADEVDRLNGLINNIFSIGRIESGSVSLDRQRILTRSLLEDVFESVTRGTTEGDLHFELDLPNDLRPVFADKHLLSVALKNLLTNAIKYNRPGGSVTLSAEALSGGLSISVADTGLGIDEEDLTQVFEKFYRSEDDSIRKVSGHGLGLALVKEIITLHGGEIQVQSTRGEGSRFTFFFAENSALFQEES